jgi:nitroreductase
MDFEKLIDERYTVRSYSDKIVDRELINKILEAGRKAPSAKNQQPYKIYVCESNEALNKVDSVSPCRYGAPLCIMIASSKEEAWSKEEYSSYDTDSTICMTYMMLEATNLGLNSVWVGMFDTNKAMEVFNTGSYIPVSMLMIGYKKDGVGPLPTHTNRKEINELIEFL